MTHSVFDVKKKMSNFFSRLKKMVYAISLATLTFSIFFLSFVFFYRNFRCTNDNTYGKLDEQMNLRNEKKSFRWQKLKTSHLGQRQLNYEHSPTRIGKKVTRDRLQKFTQNLHYTLSGAFDDIFVMLDNLVYYVIRAILWRILRTGHAETW